MLEARDVRAGFGRLEVLHGVSIGVPDGGAVAILGPNGAGKSTLLKVLARQLPVLSGELVLAGRSYGAEDATWAARHGIALVPQTENVFRDLSVRENLRLSAMRRADGAAASEEALARLPELAARGDQLAGSLSGGERQMLAIAAALLLQPRLLLLDEPTTGLAPKAAEATAETIAAATRAGTAVLWVVEQMHELALRRVQHAYVMEAGQVQFEGAPQELMENGRLERMLLHRA